MKYLPILLLALLWEGLVQFGLVSRDLLPSLSDKPGGRNTMKRLPMKMRS